MQAVWSNITDKIIDLILFFIQLMCAWHWWYDKAFIRAIRGGVGGKAYVKKCGGMFWWQKLARKEGVSFGGHFNDIVNEYFLCFEYFVVVRNNYF